MGVTTHKVLFRSSKMVARPIALPLFCCSCWEPLHNSLVCSPTLAYKWNKPRSVFLVFNGGHFLQAKGHLQFNALNSNFLLFQLVLLLWVRVYQKPCRAQLRHAEALNAGKRSHGGRKRHQAKTNSWWTPQRFFKARDKQWLFKRSHTIAKNV